jgi:hypothetical protein
VDCLCKRAARRGPLSRLFANREEQSSSEDGDVLFYREEGGSLAAGLVVGSLCTHRFVVRLTLSEEGELGVEPPDAEEAMQVCEGQVLAVLPASSRQDASASQLALASARARQAAPLL